MRLHRFTLIVDTDILFDDLANAVFEVGCDDALVVCRNGVWYLDFDRPSKKSLSRTVARAIRQLGRGGIEASRVYEDQDEGWD